MSQTPPANDSTILFPRQYLNQAIARERLSHAYVLLGPEGSGKRMFALEFAQALFCQQGGPCGICAPCRSVAHGNHAGVNFYGPAEGKSSVDIDTVRKLCERSHFTREHVFVAILERADTMTVPAANALLKTLEEPRGDFIVLLTAPSSGGLLPTIISRCHRLYFPWPGVVTDMESSEDEEQRVDLEQLADIRSADFFARNDVREWLGRVVPGLTGARDRVRRLIDVAMGQLRREIQNARGPQLDRGLDGLDALLDLRGSLDGNVSPDLVLEKVLQVLA